VRPADEPRTRERQRIRRFAAAHVAAVLVLYAVALVTGGGFAAPPFPPNLPSRPTAGKVWPASRPVVDESERTAARRADPVPAMPTTADMPAPWSIDADGRVHLRSD
jgi:hypothetical protein